MKKGDGWIQQEIVGKQGSTGREEERGRLCTEGSRRVVGVEKVGEQVHCIEDESMACITG